MPKTPKEDSKEPEQPDESNDRDLWSEDQKSRKYYYDDAHGYKDFDPSSEPEEDEDEAAS